MKDDKKERNGEAEGCNGIKAAPPPHLLSIDFPRLLIRSSAEISPVLLWMLMGARLHGSACGSCVVNLSCKPCIITNYVNSDTEVSTGNTRCRQLAYV